MKLPLYRQVYEELRKDIMDGIYLPGDYLPPIREEAKRLGVARNTVENAYLMLAEEGYVQTRRGLGSQVADVWRSFYYKEDSGTKDSGIKNYGTRDSGTKDSGTKNSGIKNYGTRDSGTEDSGTGDFCNTAPYCASTSNAGIPACKEGIAGCSAEAEALRLNLLESRSGKERKRQIRKTVRFDFRGGTCSQLTLPMIASSVTICTFMTLTSAFKQFDVNVSLTGGTGSVANFLGSYLTNGTQMLALNIYNTAVSQNNYALGQAKAVLFFIILACVSLIQVRISNAREVEL